MAKFCGSVGFVKQTCETSPGVWTDVVFEKPYRGDVTRNYYSWQYEEKLNDDFIMSDTISIVADAFAYDNISFIKYVNWMGARWKVKSVEPQRPRLILTLGGVYNGEVPECCEETPTRTPMSFREDDEQSECVLSTSRVD